MSDKETKDRLAQSLKAAEGPEVPRVETQNGGTIMPPARKKPDIGNVAEAVSRKSVQQAAKVVEVNDEFGYDVAFNFAFLGAGQGGGRIADSFYRLGYRRVAVFNLTDSDFDGLSDKIPKHHLEVGGAAKDMAFAQAQLDRRDEEVWDLLTRAWGNDVDYAMICVGLGGGSGGGTSPKLVEIARKYLEGKGKPPRVGAIISLPTLTEGQKVCGNAVLAFKKLRDMGVSPLIVIDNERIHKVYEPPMGSLLPTANSSVSQYLHLFNQLAAVHSEYITFDRSELAQLLDGGIVVMGAAHIGDLDTIKSPADVSQAIRDELSNNVLAEVDLKSGRKGCCLFVASKEIMDTFSKDYFDAGYAQLDRMVGSASEPVLHRGLYLGSSSGLQAYTMVSELEPPKARLLELARKAGLDGSQYRTSLGSFLGLEGPKA